MRKSRWRILGIAIVASLSIATAWHFDLIRYGFQQLNGQMALINGAVPIAELLESDDLDSTTRSKLIFIQEVRRFAIDSLGFKDTENYTSYFDQKGKPLLWVVTGSLHFELKEKTWWFPVINTVSYKGFFEESLAEQEAKSIEADGYESDIYNPGGWSTLGFFNDPVLSNMTKRGPGKLAELIIHEMAHSTCFVEGDVDLNENLATLAGEIGANRFLIHKYGDGSKEALAYQHRLADDETYYSHMLNGHRRLDSLYKSFNEKIDLKTRAEKKFGLIADILLEINFLELKNKAHYRFDFSKDKLPGNPEFISYSRYRKNLVELKSLLQDKFKGDIGNMLFTIEKEGASVLR
jgi:predicted aminopeptidase